jgi:hypothetical protein
MHLEELNRLGLAVLMRQVGASDQRELSTELPPASIFFGSGRVPALDAGARNSAEPLCFRIGSRVIQPPLI